MRCEDVRREFTAYIAGELDADTVRAVDLHLAECSECAQELSALRETARLLTKTNLADVPSHLEHAALGPIVRKDAVRPGDAPVAGGPTWRARAASALVPSLAAGVVVLGLLGFNWQEESAELRQRVDSWEDRYGPWGRSMTTFQLAGATGTTAHAELVRSGDDNYMLVLHVADLEPSAPGSHYEVWLTGPGGRVPGGSFTVTEVGDVNRSFPLGVDPEDFPTVEVTLESDYDEADATGVTVMEADIELP